VKRKNGVFGAGCLLLTTVAVISRAQAGPVVGVIDAVRYEGDQYYVFGWACQQGNRASIGVHIYAGGAAGGKPPGTFVTPGTADFAQ
jgi:predicted Zn-dependent protease